MSIGNVTMKIQIILLSVVILSFILAPNISAKSSDIFIDYLTDLIWKDCNGEDININQPIINYTTENHTSYLRIIEWPYERSTLRRIIELFGEQQHLFATFFGTCTDKGVTISGIDGCGILTCGNNKLDINGYNYLWNDVKVDVPKEEFKIASGNNSQIIETGDNSPVTTGEKSPITTGDHSPNNQQENNISVQMAFGAGSIFGTIIGIILKILFDMYRKNNARKKTA